MSVSAKALRASGAGGGDVSAPILTAADLATIKAKAEKVLAQLHAPLTEEELDSYEYAGIREGTRKLVIVDYSERTILGLCATLDAALAALYDLTQTPFEDVFVEKHAAILAVARESAP